MQSSSNEQEITISVALKEDEQQLGKVTITAVERKNTEVAMVQLAKNSSVIVSNILTVSLRVSIPLAAMHLTGA